MTTPVKIAKRDAEPATVAAHVSKSGRWAAHRHLSGSQKGKAWDVSHVATGVSASVTARTLADARAFLEAFDAVPTPGLDALPFGMFTPETGAAIKPELLAIWDARKATMEAAR